ncbi:DinB family protein [Aquimarina sp. BL5]|uniref:DinB family protein n=1 Tax=Aquimarina sp. BL5 TaxID=1714860 RepID=UPI000E4F0D9D|nr:DinB family protein [Aquimarina sp. BL5]AXT49911.1 DinB family protein [Aquimarina sp. BL5]RKM91635.1 DinB family protein [Aquimarina sp. BL5]
MQSLLTSGEYNPYYGVFIDQAENANILIGLQQSKQKFIDFVNTISDEKLTYAYAEGKWTIAEVLQHIIDTERIFSYRALRFARNDKSPLIGFDQDEYVPNSNANNYSRQELIEDFEAARNNTVGLFKSFTQNMLTEIGEASGSPMSVRAIGYVLSGHQKHHLHVIKDRYL